MVDSLSIGVAFPRDMARRGGALLTAIAGVINIVSALYPAIPSRMEVLTDLLPLTVIRSAQTATVLLGFALILLADGLRKRRARALQLTVLLLLLSAAFHLTKGLDYEEAILALALAFGLMAVRERFDVPSRAAVPPRLFSSVTMAVTLYYSYVLAGFVILRRAITPAPSIKDVTMEPLRLLVDAPMYHYLSPQARWFERSMAFLAGFLALYFVTRAIRPFIRLPRATVADRERVRTIMQRWATDTLSYFSLQDGRSYFFDPSGEAFLSYRLWGNVALVGGDPVGSPDRTQPLIESFIEFATYNGMEPCFVGVAGAGAYRYHALGMRTLKIGEEALLDLQHFQLDSLKRKVRRAARHIDDLDMQALVYRRDEVPAEVMTQIRDISRDWVRAKGGNERGFSMTLGRIPRVSDRDCELIVARQGEVVFGYLSLAPVYRANAWSLDAMRRRPDSPNGLMEFLVIQAAQIYRDRGFSTLSLNFATLSNEVGDIDSRALDETRRFLYENLSSFYQLRSLYQFNSKFGPTWSSRYLAYRDVRKIPKLAVAIAQSEDPIRLPSVAALLRR